MKARIAGGLWENSEFYEIINLEEEAFIKAIEVLEHDPDRTCFNPVIEGDGHTRCSISQAAVSIMTTLLQGRSLTDAEGLADRFTSVMRGDEDAARDKALGDLRALQGVSKFPVRVKCALLGFDALREALRQSAEEPAS